MSSKKNIIEIASSIRDVPDFPKKGIVFKDITPVLSDINLFRKSIDLMVEPFNEEKIDVVVGIESRGFIFGTPIADKLNASFVPVRKPGKLPHETEHISYQLEYGKDSLEIHKDSINEKDAVLIIDDLIATGGTAEAAAKLIEISKGKVAAFIFVINLFDLGGSENLSKKKYNVENLIDFPGH